MTEKSNERKTIALTNQYLGRCRRLHMQKHPGLHPEMRRKPAGARKYIWLNHKRSSEMDSTAHH